MSIKEIKIIRDYSKFDSSALCVHSDLQLHVLDECLQHALPVLLEWSVPVARDRYPPVLVLHTQVGDLYLVEFDLRSLLRLHGLKLHELASVRVIQLHALIHSGKGSLSCLRDLCLPVVLGLFLVLNSGRLGRVLSEGVSGKRYLPCFYFCIFIMCTLLTIIMRK